MYRNHHEALRGAAAILSFHRLLRSLFLYIFSSARGIRNNSSNSSGETGSTSPRRGITPWKVRTIGGRKTYKQISRTDGTTRAFSPKERNLISVARPPRDRSVADAWVMVTLVITRSFSEMKNGRYTSVGNGGFRGIASTGRKDTVSRVFFFFFFISRFSRMKAILKSNTTL